MYSPISPILSPVLFAYPVVYPTLSPPQPFALPAVTPPSQPPKTGYMPPHLTISPIPIPQIQVQPSGGSALPYSPHRVVDGTTLAERQLEPYAQAFPATRPVVRPVSTPPTPMQVPDTGVARVRDRQSVPSCAGFVLITPTAVCCGNAMTVSSIGSAQPLYGRRERPQAPTPVQCGTRSRATQVPRSIRSVAWRDVAAHAILFMLLRLSTYLSSHTTLLRTDSILFSSHTAGVPSCTGCGVTPIRYSSPSLYCRVLRDGAVMMCSVSFLCSVSALLSRCVCSLVPFLSFAIFRRCSVTVIPDILYRCIRVPLTSVLVQ